MNNVGARLGLCLVCNYNIKAEIKTQNWEQVYRNLHVRRIYFSYVFKKIIFFLWILHPFLCLPPCKSWAWWRGPKEEATPGTKLPSCPRPQLHPAMFLRRTHPTGDHLPALLLLHPVPGKARGALADGWTTYTASAISPKAREQWLHFILFNSHSVLALCQVPFSSNSQNNSMREVPLLATVIERETEAWDG